MRHSLATVIIGSIFSIIFLMASEALAAPSSAPVDAVKSDAAKPDAVQAPRPSAEKRFWANLKGIPLGPLTLDLGAGLRLRGEAQENFDIKKYGDGQHDMFLLERLRVEVGLRYGEGLHLFLQGQDAHELAFGQQ